MARSGFPSMTALLGLLAVAGYQNRDKLSEMLGNRQGAGGMGGGGMGGGGSLGGGGGLGGLLGGLGGAAGGSGGGLESILGGLMGGRQGGGQGGGQGAGQGGMAGGATTGGMGGGLGGLLGGGLGEMRTRFDQAGRGRDMDSWVGDGPNSAIEPHDLEAALGPEVLEDLQETTGLPRDELLRRLSRELPEAVNQYTPHGRLPRDDDFA